MVNSTTEQNQAEAKHTRIPKAYQYLLFCIVAALSIFLSVTTIGYEEYNKQFCESKLSLGVDERPALLRDFVTPYTSTASNEGGHESLSYGCCRIPKDGGSVSRRKNCVTVLDYQKPSMKERVLSFLKRFK